MRKPRLTLYLCQIRNPAVYRLHTGNLYIQLPYLNWVYHAFVIGAAPRRGDDVGAGFGQLHHDTCRQPGGYGVHRMRKHVADAQEGADGGAAANIINTTEVDLQIFRI